MITGRSRSTGSSTFRTVKIKAIALEARRIYSSGAYKMEYRETPVEQTAGYYADDTQTMVDTVGARSRFNAVTHAKKFDCPMGDSVTGASVNSPLYQGGTYTWTVYGYRSVSLQPMGGFSAQWRRGTGGSGIPDIGSPSIDWANLVYQVGGQLDGHMQTGQNLLVSAVGLSQTIRMIKNPFGLKRALKQTGRKKSLGELLKTPANALLEYEFGWKNLWLDYQALANVWQEVRNHQEHLRATAQKYVSLAARQEIHTPNSSVVFSPLTVGNIINTPSVGITVTPVLKEVVTSACFSLDVRRTMAQQSWSTFDQVCSRLGGRDIALALWDLVPYSFVVDWFTHVNRWVEQRPIVWNSNDIRYAGYSISKKWMCTLDFKSVSTVQPIAMPRLSQTIQSSSGPHCVQKSYVRTAGFPAATSSVGFFGSLNKTQIAEGIALIVQRL